MATSKDGDLRGQIRNILEESGEIAFLYKAHIRSRLVRKLGGLLKEGSVQDLNLDDDQMESKSTDNLLSEFVKVAIQNRSGTAVTSTIATQTDAPSAIPLETLYNDMRKATQRCQNLCDTLRGEATSELDRRLIRWEREFSEGQKDAMDTVWERRRDADTVQAKEAVRSRMEQEVERLRELILDRQPKRVDRKSQSPTVPSKANAEFSKRRLEKTLAAIGDQSDESPGMTSERIENTQLRIALSQARRAIESQVQGNYSNSARSHSPV